MTDLELMQLLEDEGYEPSLENLMILKEEIENEESENLLETSIVTKEFGKNGEGKTLPRSFGRGSAYLRATTNKGDNQRHLNAYGTNLSRVKAADTASNDGKAYKGSLDNPYNREEANGKGYSGFGSLRYDINKAADDQGAADKARALRKKNAQELAEKGISVKKKRKEAYEANIAAKQAKKNSLKESFSDYELYQILESNGYTTTETNLSILKEGLETGKYFIED